MLNTEQLQAYFTRNHIPPAARQVIEDVRESAPTRRVGGGTHNVACRFASDKMGQVIQAESHKGELPAIYVWEHDPATYEFYDQPPPVKLSYRNATGKTVTHMSTPDFFVLREGWAGWVEFKPEEHLLQSRESGCERFILTEDGTWRCPPGEQFAAQFGLSFKVMSSKEHNHLFVRNLEFLTDYFDTSCPSSSDEARQAVERAFADNRWLLLSDLLGCDGIAADTVYTMIAKGQLHALLESELLSEPIFTYICRDEFSAQIYKNQRRGAQEPEGRSLTPLNAVELVAGTPILWDGKPWRILNVGDHEIFLHDEAKTISPLLHEQFKTLVSSGDITGLESSVDDRQAAADQALRQASNLDLDSATERQRAILAEGNIKEEPTGAPGSEKEKKPTPKRTLDYWKKLAREGEMLYGNSYVGLISRKSRRGNRNRKISDKVIELMTQIITTEVLTKHKPLLTACYGALITLCNEESVQPPSDKTFRAQIKRYREEKIILAREGRRAAYSVSEFVWHLDQSAPRHGERPFEIGHIDHTQLDIELTDSLTGSNLGRPWLTVLMDAFTRMILAIYLTFDPPSYRSCMMVIRNAVIRHHRIPKTIVVDQGSDFESAYFERLLARLKSHKKSRPAAKARFGSVIERFFGVANQAFLHNLAGNTQASKNPRRMSPSHDPKKLAVWTLPSLSAAIEEYAYERYADMPHSALGMPPRVAMARGLAMAGERTHMLIPFSEGFKLLCLPTTPAGKAKVRAGKGIKILGIHYWHASFRDPRIAGKTVDIRYDPFDISRAYAFVDGAWQLCRSEYQANFERRTEREIATISQELRAFKRIASSDPNRRLRAEYIAAYLNALRTSEAVLLQQRRDAEKLAANKELPPASPPTSSAFESRDDLWSSSQPMNTYEDLK